MPIQGNYSFLKLANFPQSRDCIFFPTFSSELGGIHVKLFYSIMTLGRRTVIKQNQEHACVSQIMQLSVLKWTKLLFSPVQAFKHPQHLSFLFDHAPNLYLSTIFSPYLVHKCHRCCSKYGDISKQNKSLILGAYLKSNG